jgi:uncharacterized membrane protein
VGRRCLTQTPQYVQKQAAGKSRRKETKMVNKNVARGLFLACMALGFGVSALQHPLGSLSRAGPGLFPLMMSSALLVIALFILVQARFAESEPLEFNPVNISRILLGLCALAALTEWVNMTAGIVALVFIVSGASSSPSWQRSVKVSIGLIAVALAFKKLLGLNLPLY